MTNELLFMGQVAKRAGVNVETIRYYERRNLLKPNGYRDSGYRLYAPDAVQRIRFIKHAQALGFTLKEIAELLRLRVSREAHCGDVKKRADRKLEDVERKIEHLTSIHKILKELIQACHSKARTEDCPILKSLERSGQ